MAEMTMVGNWTGPHSSSFNQQPPTSTGVRPAGAYRDPASTAQGRRSSSPPPPATGRRPIAPAVDIQICMALSGRPASLEGLSPEPEDMGSAAAPGSGAMPVAPSHCSWSGDESVVPLARARAVRVPQALPSSASVAAEPAATPPAAMPSAAQSAAVPSAAVRAAVEPRRAQPAAPAPAAPVPAAPSASILLNRGTNEIEGAGSDCCNARSFGALAPSGATKDPALQWNRRTRAARRKDWLLAALTALVAALLASTLLVRLHAPLAAPGAVPVPVPAMVGR